jgi:cytochrome c biogenesis protein CcmG/thiol:disulfide interchange protein DsbE
MKGWALWLPLILFVLFMGLASSGLFRPEGRVIESKMIGKQLPDFALPPAATGQPALARADIANGQPHLLNIFASWCVPCAAESPQLMQLSQRGASVQGVAIRDARADVDGFLARYGNPYARIGLDARSAIQFAIGSSGVPETFVVDGKGIIRYQHIGVIMPDDVPVLLQKLEEAR